MFEKIIDYSDCVEYDVKTQQFTKQMCKEIEPNITVGQSLKCFCKESFNISEDITVGSVEIDGFYIRISFLIFLETSLCLL